MPNASTAPAPDGIVSLVRRWAVDWINSHDPSACEGILEPDYVLHIGSLTLRSRDEYVSGTVGQLALFPGLVLTVHDVLSTEDQCAVRFSEHGASTRHEGAVAAWTGIALHRWNGRLLTETYCEEDYLSRQRQLASGSFDPVEPPAPAPWDTLPGEASSASEHTVREWLAGGGLDEVGGVRYDDLPATQPRPALLAVERVEVETMFSSGDRVAFHARAFGRAADTDCSLGVAGLVEVADGVVSGGHVVRDRLGLRRQVTNRGSS